MILAAALRGKPLRLGSFRQPGITRFLKSAGKHGLSQLINQKICDHQIQGLPVEEVTKLAQLSNIKVAYDIILNESTQKSLELLADHQIPVLLLKGTAVAFKYYDDSSLRTRCDTDLFIREQDRDRVAELLAANNYAIHGYERRHYVSKQFIAGLNGNSPAATTFDIHWKLSNRTLFNNILQFDECWEMRQPVKQLGESAFTLLPTQLLLHACIHRIAHGRNSDRNRLIWLYDIHLIITSFSEIEFDAFLEMAKARAIGTLCADGIIMSQYYFGTRFPRDYLAKLTRNQSKETSAKLIWGGAVDINLHGWISRFFGGFALRSKMALHQLQLLRVQPLEQVGAAGKFDGYVVMTTVFATVSRRKLRRIRKKFFTKSHV